MGLELFLKGDWGVYGVSDFFFFSNKAHPPLSLSLLFFLPLSAYSCRDGEKGGGGGGGGGGGIAEQSEQARA